MSASKIGKSVEKDTPGYTQDAELEIRAVILCLKEKLAKNIEKPISIKHTSVVSDHASVSRGIRIRAFQVPAVHRDYEYQRRLSEMPVGYRIFLGRVPILLLLPKEVVWYQLIINRSPQFKRIHREIKAFLEKHYPYLEHTFNAEVISG